MSFRWYSRSQTRTRRKVPSAFATISEPLEERQLLSAVCIVPTEPEAADVAKNSAEQHQRKRFRINLSGEYAIPTPAGQVDLIVQQHGKKVGGTADLNDLDLTTLANLPFPLPIPIDVPPVEFKGTFKKMMLNIDFVSQVNLPVIGTPLFTVTGNITAQVQFTGLVGHLTVNIGDNQVISTDFTTPLPTP